MSDERKLEQQAAEAKQEVKDEELEKVAGGVQQQMVFVQDTAKSIQEQNVDGKPMYNVGALT